jgi:cellulose synthase/poly-beta-1,6-N-acetylglucosamine synthase-like glycosyltransferase
MLPKLTVIIPAKNEEKVIGNCLKSILDSDYPKSSLQVIVAVDGCSDRTVDICNKFKPAVDVIETEENSCKAEAINRVLKYAKGEIIGIYDSDCIVERDCLRMAAKAFEDKKIAGVSGAIKSYNKNKNIITRALSLETSFVFFTEYFLNRFGANAHFLGKNIYMRKKALEKLKGFNTYSFTEDLELSLRFKRHNYKVICEPKAVAWHEEAASLKSFINQRKRWARGLFRVIKLKRTKTFRHFFSDSIHGIYFYASPFGLLSGMLYAITSLFGFHWIITLPLFALFTFSLLLLGASVVYLKHSVRDLAYIPAWFILSNIQAVIFLKACIDEKMGKKIEWFRVVRDDYILRQ